MAFAKPGRGRTGRAVEPALVDDAALRTNVGDDIEPEGEVRVVHQIGRDEPRHASLDECCRVVPVGPVSGGRRQIVDLDFQRIARAQGVPYRLFLLQLPETA